ncbi:uncharacterized protein LOC120354991 [Nilaparvata lugens]|uniref:uncharacterized protein LOC120354991 n=1 Tax=Nilaparvata lugens TaxID=108931 RepID=UPI00193CACA8|nr:uncharacterized protein LOC120354991 [Nilaparvata lugens]
MHYLTSNAIIVGDINIDLLNGKENSTIYLSLMENNGFSSIVDKATRITSRTKTLIDHIFIKHRQINSFKHAIFDLNITDHCLLGLKFDENRINLEDNSSLSVTKQSITDIDKVCECLQLLDWNDVYQIEDVNLSYERFHSILTDLVNKCSKTINSNNRLTKAKIISPWITTDLLRKIERRRKLYKLLKKRPYDTPLRDHYNTYYDNLKNEIDSTKRNFYSNCIRIADGDPARQWRVINSLTGESRNQIFDKVELEDGTIECDPQNVANKVNRYLINVVQPDCNIPSSVCLGLYHQCRSFFIEPTTDNEILKVISNLKNKKSSGFDKFNILLIKRIALYIAPVLTHIFNLSFSKGVFPEMLKMSVVIPIFKKKNSIKLNNIRPISLLSVFSKILEKLMINRLVTYLNTEDALLNFSNLVYNSLNNSNKTTGLYIDFTKAFDLINHEILFLKLEAAGVRGVALRWFRSFLSNREHQVRVGAEGCLSSPLPVTVGVPQGSVSSAILFIIFINDLLNIKFNGIIQAFADDIAFLYSHKSKEVIKNNIVADLSILREWCSKNKMIVNVSKTKYINFDYRAVDFSAPILYHSQGCTREDCSCEEIERVDSFKYLGLTFDEKMSWKKHIQILHGDIRRSIRKFYYLRNLCDQTLMKSLYYALIHSRLQYGLICWGGTFKTFINRLRISQNHIIRLILHKRKRESSFPLYCNLKIMPIQNLYIFKVLKMFYLISGNCGIENLYYNMRSNDRILYRTPKVKKCIFRNSCLFIGPYLFNKLPLNIKICASYTKYCKKLIHWLFELNDTSTLRTVLR